MKPLAVVLTLAALACAAPASADTLTQKDLRVLFPGSYMVKIFGRWDLSVRMSSNGSVTGRAGDRTDKGRWSIEGNKLCIAWSNWTSGRKGCSALTRSGRKISGRGFYFNV